MDQAAPTTQLNRAVLQEVFPLECEIVGSENLLDLCAGHKDFQDGDKGYHLDVAAYVSLLSSAVTIIGVVWPFLKKHKRSNRPSHLEIDQLVINSVQVKKLSGEQRQEVYIALMIKHDAEQD